MALSGGLRGGATPPSKGKGFLNFLPNKKKKNRGNFTLFFFFFNFGPSNFIFFQFGPPKS
jgi:hypothetical protein